jgi:putative DNA methylase
VNPEAKKKLGASGSWKGAAGLAEDIRYYGQWMRDEAEKRIGHLYPMVKLPKEHGGGEASVIAWVWARTVASPNPAAKGAHVPLVRSFWLSTKAGKKAWVEPVVDHSTMTYRFRVQECDGKAPVGTVGRNGGVCLLTGSPIPLEYVRNEGQAQRLGVRLMAIIAEGVGRRIYFAPTDEDEQLPERAVPKDVPETEMPEAALGFRVQNYGMKKHSDLFTRRQLLALTTFSDLVGDARAKVIDDGDRDTAYADAVATYLGLLVSKSADYWSNLCIWRSDPKNLGIGHVFSRHAVSMIWDFAEGNPLSASSGSWASSQRWTELVLKGCFATHVGHVSQRSASDVAPGVPPMYSTDPPYYDNVPYADLSDFFYIWQRRCLRSVYPKLLGTVLVPKAEELVADPFHHDGKEKARSFFERGIGKVFERMRATGDPRFPTTIYYAFKQAENDEDEGDQVEDSNATRASTGWETFLQGLVDAGWQVDGTWPMRTELGNRTRSMGSNALASSIILVCRPRPNDAGVASRRDYLAALKKELPEALRNLQKGNIAPVDLAQAAIGPGMAVFSRYARVLEADGSPMSVRTALALINNSLDEVLAEQEGEFDADTRWALAWFDQNGFNEGAYGVAETLCTAKNTSVSGMV